MCKLRMLTIFKTMKTNCKKKKGGKSINKRVSVCGMGPCHSGQGESPFVCTLIVYFTGKHGAKGDDCEGWSLRS